MENVMEFTMLAFILLSLLLLVASFFTKDKFKQLEEQVDNLTMSFVQETYQIKKKLKILEEELLIDEEQIINLNLKKSHYAPPFSSEQDRIVALYKQGFSYEQIAKETSLTTEEVRMMLQKRNLRGMGQ